MSVPAHLWLYDNNGVLITGGSEVARREGSIEIQSFNHGVTVPTDGNTGRLTSARVHNVMSIEKDFDKSTPYLYRAVSTGQNIQKAIIKWYRINDAGMEDEFLNMIMENVRITSIHPTMHNFKSPEGQLSTPRESLGMRYAKITWRYLDGNITYTDEWNSNALA